MSQDKGGVEALIYFKSDKEVPNPTTVQPSIEVVAIPVDEDNEYFSIVGRLMIMQLSSSKVNGNDLTRTTFGDCCGYVSVYPGYVSKRMEPPKQGEATYTIERAFVYIDGEKTIITALLQEARGMGEGIDFRWGTFE